MPEQNLGSDDEDDGWAPFRSYLQDRGLSRDEAEEACRIVQDARRRSRANGRDRTSRDSFPVNRVRGSEREAPSGGRFGGERRSGETQTNGALDSARLAKRFPGASRIEVEPSVASSDRHAMDQAPTIKRRSRTLARFPDMAAIKTGADTGFVFRDEKPTKGRFEV